MLTRLAPLAAQAPVQLASPGRSLALLRPLEASRRACKKLPFHLWLFSSFHVRHFHCRRFLRGFERSFCLCERSKVLLLLEESIVPDRLLRLLDRRLFLVLFSLDFLSRVSTGRRLRRLLSRRRFRVVSVSGNHFCCPESRLESGF